MKKTLFIIAIASLVLFGTARAVSVFNSGQVGTNPVNGYYLQTNGATSTWAAVSGGGGIASTTPFTSGQFTVVSSSGALATNGFSASSFAPSTTISSQWTTTSTGLYYNGGNVGIGTASPATLLNVGSGTPTTATSGIQFGTDSTANLYRSSAGTIKTDGYLTVGGTLQFNGQFFVGNTGGIQVRDPSGAANTRGISGLQYVQSGGTSTSYFMGNVGVGTTSPAFPLDVSGTIHSVISSNISNVTLETNQNGMSNGSIFFKTSYPGGSNFGLGYSNTASTFALRDLTATSSPYRFVVDNQGNVGIGTSTPSGLLHLYSASTAVASKVQTAADALAYSEYKNIDGNMWVGKDSSNSSGLIGTGGIANAGAINVVAADALQFGTNNTARLTIASSGNVGIGTTGPSGTFEVRAPNAVYNNATLGALNLSYNTTKRVFAGYDGTLNAGFIQAIDYGTAYKNLLLNPNGGNVGIGTAAPSSTLHVVGNGIFTTGLAVGTTTTSTATLNVISNTTTTASFVNPTATTTVIEGSASSSVCDVKYTASSSAVYVTYLGTGQQLISTTSCQ